LRQRKTKRRAFTRLRLRPHLSTMPRDNPLDDREPHTRPRILTRTVQSPKDTKQVRAEPAVESDAIVSDFIDQPLALFAPTHTDPRLRDLARVFDRVVEQVQPHLTNQPLVASRPRQITDLDAWRHRFV